MCLLVTQNKTSPALTDEWLIDFYSYNSDGVGVMYSEDGSLIIEKVLPKDAHAFIQFYRTHIEGKTCAYHLRMRTHGDTDLENCHPYEVLNRQDHGIDLWLMHNGILSTGNSADTTKSDTWHYIRNYLRPMLENNPDFAFHPKFAEIVGAHIGTSNKFVLMDNNGRTATINQSEGVYWGGLWLSNEYAWSATSSTSDKPIKSLKTAKKQIKESPERYPRTPLSNYYSPNQLDNLMWDEIDSIFAEMEHEGKYVASSLSWTVAEDFIRYFGSESFGEIAYKCIDGMISEQEFLDVMEDRKTALEKFSWLSDVVYAERGEYAY